MLRYKLIASDGHTIGTSNKLDNLKVVLDPESIIIDTKESKVVVYATERGDIVWVEK